MPYLQLAEDSNMLAENPLEHYILIPAGFMNNTTDKYVREDYFDNLPAEQYKALMLRLAPYQTHTMSEGEIIDAASFAAGFIPGVGPIAGKAIQQVGSLIKRRQERVASGEKKPLFGGLFKKKSAQAPGAVPAVAPTTEVMPTGATSKGIPPIDASVNVGGQEFQFSTEKKPGFWASQSTTTKGLIIGGAVLAVGTIGYLALRKKKRK